MMNARFQNLPLKWKVTLSSSAAGLILYLYSQFLQLDDVRFLGVGIGAWEWGLFMGCMMAWSELWSRDIKKASVLFLAGMGSYLLVYGYRPLLPEPLEVMVEYYAIFFPHVVVLLFIKIAIEKGKAALKLKVVAEVLIAGIIFKILYSYFPKLIFENGFADISPTASQLYYSFLYSPLFYWMFFRMQQELEWKSLVPVKEISRLKFTLSYLLCWSLLLFGIYKFISSINSYDYLLSPKAWEGIFLSITISNLVDFFYMGLSLLALAYCCTKLLASWYLTIKKPLGWLYLFSFAPLLNIFTITYLLLQKPYQWGTSIIWQEFLEDERRKFATRLVAFILLGSFISFLFVAFTNEQVQAGSLYISLLNAIISTAAVYALYKGWTSFFTVAAAYSLLHGLLLVVDPQISPIWIIISIILRCLTLLICYQAIKPSANKPLQQQLMAA